MEFASRLTRRQSGIFGAIGGYAPGVTEGLVLKLSAYLFMLVSFAFIGNSLQEEF